MRENNVLKDRINARALKIFEESRNEMYMYTDRLFVGLMIFQWLCGIMIAAIVSPRTWAGAYSSIHVHVWAALFLGGAIALFPVLLGIFRPGKVYTRYVISVGQMLYSALLIHLTGGRIETHFHVFGSLAFLAFYRDWKVLVPATIVVAADHYLRGVYWPESVFGVLITSPYRWIEHAAWVIFENIFLARSCIKSTEEMKRSAENTAELEFKNEQLKDREKALVELNNNLDKKVLERTQNLKQANEELHKTHAELKNAQIQLIQSEKLASIGQLAAGVAHEINNPIGFISNNMEVLQEYIQHYTTILRMIEKVKEHVEHKDMERIQSLLNELDQFEKDIDLNYIMDDMSKLLQHSDRGLERIKRIVMDLMTFSREENAETVSSIKVEEVIDGILNIVQSEIKYKAELVKEYGETGTLQGNAQRLGQVFINLLINATQAMQEKGKITIKTYRENGCIGIDVSDTGKGISEENLTRIFDPFFTTKPVGQGTGLGLSVSYEIVKKHGGEMKVYSKVGRGTTFTIKLPVKS